MGALRTIRDVHALACRGQNRDRGGNIFRGLAASTRGMDCVGDVFMGKRATVINGSGPAQDSGVRAR
jgi:hypothetical protein